MNAKNCKKETWEIFCVFFSVSIDVQSRSLYNTICLIIKKERLYSFNLCVSDLILN